MADKYIISFVSDGVYTQINHLIRNMKDVEKQIDRIVFKMSLTACFPSADGDIYVRTPRRELIETCAFLEYPAVTWYQRQ